MNASRTLLTRYLEKYHADFHQTYSIDALWDRDERFSLLGQKVKVQGHGGIEYAEKFYSSVFRCCFRDFVSDFELMLQRKKDEMKKRRRSRRDVDIINDNDDLIDDLIRRMMEAAEVGVRDIQCIWLCGGAIRFLKYYRSGDTPEVTFEIFRQKILLIRIIISS